MLVDPQIVAELRALFLDGATPSRLVRHIANRHEGDPAWPSCVEQYFAEAFAVTTLVIENPSTPVDLDRIEFQEGDAELLRNMVGRQAAWRQSVAPSREPLWCDGLSVSPDDLRMIEQIRPESHPALAESWSSMTPPAREFVRQAMVNAQGYHERLQVLARLVERLQEQIIALDRPCEEARA